MVSHVSDVVNGVARLINEVAKDVPVTTAGGTEDNGVGTSFEKILTAFEENKADKILAFYDLGSAKMNLEMAMEMTDKEVNALLSALEKKNKDRIKTPSIITILLISLSPL